MGIKVISLIRHSFWLLFLFMSLAHNNTLSAQTSPNYPVSYRIFNPFVFNPAIAGSKDFASAGFIIGNYGEINSQLASFHTRLAKPGEKYFTSYALPEFTNIGLGGYIFNEKEDPTNNIGVAATGSYHLQLGHDALSYLSAGITAKAIYNRYLGDTDFGNPDVNTLIPNLDAGLYFYNPSFYVGISATNILDADDNPDSLGIYNIPVTRTYYLLAGYKFILSRSENIVLEPSIIVSSGDSIPDDITNLFKPGIKLYAGNFCIGTYFNDFNKISFFGQYKYSRTYLGAYFELPWNSPYYKKPILVEFSIGVNISAVKSGVSRSYHW